MKKLFCIVLIALAGFSSHAQFTKASLQATGLTCAMCSNAINKALLHVPFVESVKADIKNSAFNMVFKQGQKVEIDALRKAVEDAGFSVGSLKMTGNFKEVKIENDKHIEIADETFHFLNVDEQVLDGEKTITVVDKNFLTAKQFKKFSNATRMSCVQTGKTAACCLKDGVAADARVYHVTM
jgi:copper chaperone CopZ